MSRYFFDYVTCNGTDRDDIGLDLPDRAAARATALRTLPRIACDVLVEGDVSGIDVLVRDNRPEPFFRATVSMTSARVG